MRFWIIPTALAALLSALTAAMAVDTPRLVEGGVSHIRDGDTLEVARVPIRFQKLDCAERGTIAGDAATRRMRQLVRGQRLSCDLTGRLSYDRHIGSCTLPDGRDLGLVMIREGLCQRYF